MKKMKKALIGLAVGAVAALGVVGLAACGEGAQTVEGEYHYSSYGNEYGVKVSVTVENNKITEVEVLNHDYVEATETVMGTWDGGVDYNAKRASLLEKFNGLSVSDVLAIDVQIDDSGAPLTVDDDGFVEYKVGSTELLISGSTQSSGRLILAVQNALEKL